MGWGGGGRTGVFDHVTTVVSFAGEVEGGGGLLGWMG